MKQFNAESLPIDPKILNDVPLRGEINIEQLVFRQIERTYASALQDESLFAVNVRLLLSTAPTHKQVLILERSNEFTSTVQSYQYKYWCGVPLGTPEHPINGSPAVITEEIIDWHKLFEIILSALEDCGITWQFDKWTIEVGKVDKLKALPTPTPIFTGHFNESAQHSSAQYDEQLSNAAQKTQDTQPSEPEKYKRPCAICNEHVHPRTGKFYHHRLVHTDTCLDVAKAKWTDGNSE